MMTNYPIEDLLPKSGGSIYRLVRLASKRALELADGKRPLIKDPATDKLTTIALEEVWQGKVSSNHALKAGTAAKKSKESSKEEKKEKQSEELKEEKV